MMMRTAVTKCVCGENAYLYFENSPGRIKNQIVNVLNCPVYICSDCGEQISNGPDCIRFAKLVKEAVAQGVKEIYF